MSIDDEVELRWWRNEFAPRFASGQLPPVGQAMHGPLWIATEAPHTQRALWEAPLRAELAARTVERDQARTEARRLRAQVAAVEALLAEMALNDCECECCREGLDLIALRAALAVGDGTPAEPWCATCLAPRIVCQTSLCAQWGRPAAPPSTGAADETPTAWVITLRDHHGKSVVGACLDRNDARLAVDKACQALEHHHGSYKVMWSPEFHQHDQSFGRASQYGEHVLATPYQVNQFDYPVTMLPETERTL